MQKRYFDHIYSEICVAVGRRVSRYDLWLLIWDAGGDPDDLTTRQARFFVENSLDDFLCEEGTRVVGRARRRLDRRIVTFDAAHPTPGEWLTGLLDRGAGVAA